MKKIQLIEISIDELEGILSKLLKEKLSELLPKPTEEDKLLSRNEAAAFLGISKVTLWDWTNQGKLRSYGIGNKVFYKKNELLDSLKPLK